MAMQKLSDIKESKEFFSGSKEFEAFGQIDLDLDVQSLGLDLKKLLVQVTGRKDIENITRVKLKVITREDGLHRLAEYTPRLRTLILDDSCVDSLRDLGSSLKLLENLSLVRCNLKSLDGLWGFRKLSTLVARDNSITDISPCSGVDKLATLDVANNKIEDLSSFVFLQSCKHLRVLDVAGNCFDDYKDVIVRLVPQIRVLDGEDIQATKSSAKEQKSFGKESAPTSEKENLIFLPEDEAKNASLDPMEMIEKKESSLKKINRSKSPPRLRELGAGDDKSIVSGLYDDYEKIILQDENKTRGEGKNLDPLSSSTFLMTREFNKISMSDLTSNVGEYHRSLETMPGKFSSGRAICGNLAVSLRSRNLSKSPFTLPAARASSPNK